MQHIALSALLFALFQSAAFTDEWAVGRWRGEATRGEAATPFEVSFTETAGALEGVITFPNSGTRDVLLDSIEATKKKILFGCESRNGIRK